MQLYVRFGLYSSRTVSHSIVPVRCQLTMNMYKQYIIFFLFVLAESQSLIVVQKKHSNVFFKLF